MHPSDHVCAQCRKGDHQNHQPALAGICIGCTCAYRPGAVTDEEPIKCATFSSEPIPADVRATMDADRAAAELQATIKYGEGFKLMRYATRDGSEAEWIWNSRDGIVPFIVPSRRGLEMTHVDWHLDEHRPDHKPKPGDRIFVRLTETKAAEYARRRVEMGWERYPVEGETKESYAAKLAAQMLAEWGGDAPDLVVVNADGSYEERAAIVQSESLPSHDAKRCTSVALSGERCSEDTGHAGAHVHCAISWVVDTAPEISVRSPAVSFQARAMAFGDARYLVDSLRECGDQLVMIFTADVEELRKAAPILLRRNLSLTAIEVGP